MKWLKNRWELKTIAFFLAVSLYFYTGTQITVERKLTVQVNEEDIGDLPPDYRPTGIRPRSFDIYVSGPKRLVDALEADEVDPTLGIGAKHLGTGRQSFDVTERMLGLPPGVRLDPPTPSIEVEFSRVVEDVLPIEDAPEVRNLPEGLSYSIALETTHLKVEGPEAAIARLREGGSLPVEPIDLGKVSSDISEPLVQTPQLLLDLPPGVSVSDEEIHARITIEPEPASRTTRPLPIHLLLPPSALGRYRVLLAGEFVALKVNGPANLLAELREEEQLRVYVDLADRLAPNWSGEVLLKVIGPSWLSHQAQQVRVTVQLAEEGTPPEEGDGEDMPEPPPPPAPEDPPPPPPDDGEAEAP